MENINCNELLFVTTGNSCATYQNPVSAPLFYKNFILKEPIGEASLLVGATGLYELYLNGERITKGYLAPYIANPEQTVFFDRYQLTDRLRAGENRLVVLLGNGFANPFSGAVWEHHRQCASPAFALHFACDDLTFTAEDMRWIDSPILFDDIRTGVLCDMFSWKGFENDHAPVRAAVQKGERRMASCEPVREIRRLKAVSVRRGALRDYRIRDGFRNSLYHGDTIMGKTQPYGGYLYDFGENNAGIPYLKIRGKAGQRVEMQFCELLFEGFADYINVDVYPDGCAQRDVYICKGEGEEIFVPPFTYHGFRYCYIYGITEEQATEELLQYLVIHNEVPVKAEFACSDEISNQIFAACRRSDESNLVNIITDCPHREKNGWTGDIAISAEQYFMQLGVENCLYDYMACVRNAQDEEGHLPLMVPSARGTEDCPVWDSILAFVPYYAWQYAGRFDFVEDNAEAMIKNLRCHISRRDERGLVERGLGDWLPVGLQAGEYHSPLGFCCSAVLMEICSKAEVMMQALKRREDADFCRESYHLLRDALREEYLCGSLVTAGKTSAYRKAEYRSCQTSQALALYVGLFTQEEEETAVQELIRMIREQKNSFDCGFLGLRVLFPVLSRYGYGDLAYQMITKPEFPSYANMIYRGETTVWERFMPPGERIGSHNHHFMAGVSAWYLQDVLGITVNPHLNDPDHILIKPDFIKALNFCEGVYRSPGGEIKVRWEQNGEENKLFVVTSGKVTVEYAEGVPVPEYR